MRQKVGSGPDRAMPDTPAFVGRDHELDHLQRALAAPPAVALIEGEAGIGKSRLVRELLAGPVMAQSRTLVGICPPFRESLTLGPVVDAVRQASPSVAGLPMSPLAGALRPLFPEWAAELPPAPDPVPDAKASRHRLFSALAELVGTLDVAVLVIEDVHWADEATLEFLLFLAARQPSGPAGRWPAGQPQKPLSLVLTYRREDLPPESLLLRLSSRLPAGITRARIELRPLDTGQTASLVSSMLGGEPLSDAFARFLHERTEGVPLTVEESVRLLCQRDDLVRRNGEWVRRSLAELRVPPTVRDSVLERIQRLDEAARAILPAAAVLTEPADDAVLAEVAGLTGERARAGLAEAVACGLLREDHRGRFQFRHVLMGAAVYESMPRVRLRRLHQRAGAALERLSPLPVVQLARHFHRAGDTARWCRYAEQAAELSISSGDHQAAAAVLENLLAAADLPAADRVRLASRLTDAVLLRREQADDLVRRVAGTLRALLATPGLGERQRGEIGGRLGRVLLQLGEHEQARFELERAIPLLSHRPFEAALAMIYLSWQLVWPRQVTDRWLARAAEQMTAVQSPVDRYILTVDRAAALLFVGDPAGWTPLPEPPAGMSPVDARHHTARACLNLGGAAAVWGRYREAERHLATAIDLAGEEFLLVRDLILAEQASLHWLTGAWSGLAERAAALAARDDVVRQVCLTATLVAGLLDAAQGRPQLAEKRLQDTLSIASHRGIMSDWLPAAAALAGLRLADGDAAGAVRMTADPAGLAQASGIWVQATEIAPVRVQALLAAGATDDAARLVAAFARGLHGCDAPAPRAALANCRAMLAEDAGEHAGAATLYSRAAAAWRRLPRPYNALLTSERQGACLIRGGRTEAGIAVLTETFHGLAALDARPAATRVMHRLREHGVAVRRPWLGGRRGYGDRLSPRELEVVRLVVAGRTNREIAQALFRSPNTVANQLNSAMRKLGVSSRTALAVAVVEAGLADAERQPDRG